MPIKKKDILQTILSVIKDWDPVSPSYKFSGDLFAVEQGLYGADEDEYIDPDSPMDEDEWEINSSNAYDAEKVIDKFCTKGITVEDLEDGSINGKDLWWDGIRAYAICVLKMYMSKDDARDFFEDEQFGDDLFEELTNLIEEG